MRTEDLFKKQCLILSELSREALNLGVTVRPFINGVIVGGYTYGGELTLYLEGEKEQIPSARAKNLASELVKYLPNGHMFRFLWHCDEELTTHAGVAKAKRVLMGDGDASDYRLTPLKCTHGTHEGKTSDWFAEIIPKELRKFGPIESHPVETQEDFDKTVKKIYADGFTSCVVKVGRERYRIKQILEEEFTIVGLLSSTRYQEVGGIVVTKDGVVTSAPVKKGLSTEDKRDIFLQNDLYLGSKVLIQYEGVSTKKTLKGARVRALRCRTL